jgi:hypothetical protein
MFLRFRSVARDCPWLAAVFPSLPGKALPFPLSIEQILLDHLPLGYGCSFTDASNALFTG